MPPEDAITEILQELSNYNERYVALSYQYLAFSFKGVRVSLWVAITRNIVEPTTSNLS